MKRPNRYSALTQILLALVPYSRQNIALSFSPNRFFNELEKSSGYKQSSLKAAYSRGKKKGLINTSSTSIKLTKQGFKEVQPFIAEQLPGGASLMVIFDIPEQHSSARVRLRRLLKNWQFQPVQKSVWMTDLDYRAALSEAILEFNLSEYVQLYECAHIT